MKVAIITVAGISSRFNAGIPETDRKLKAIYYEGDETKTILWQLVRKCAFADKVIIVGGYKFSELEEYCARCGWMERIDLLYNDHYEDYASGYSLFLGINKALEYPADEVLFAEGDLDVDDDSFEKIIQSSSDVLSYNRDPIYANKAVVLYQDDQGHYCYAFSTNHGLLSIESPFSCILNSGQIWKFTDMRKLQKANDWFGEGSKKGTNLEIIQKYIDQGADVAIVGLERWTNCNTREDYKHIQRYWEEEQ